MARKCPCFPKTGDHLAADILIAAEVSDCGLVDAKCTHVQNCWVLLTNHSRSLGQAVVPSSMAPIVLGVFAPLAGSASQSVSYGASFLLLGRTLEPGGRLSRSKSCSFGLRSHPAQNA